MEELEKLKLRIVSLQQDADQCRIEKERIEKLFMTVWQELKDKKDELKRINNEIDFAQNMFVQMNLS